MIKRLTKDDDESWALYPKFQNFVRAFAQHYEVTCPIEPILLEMQQRWVVAPDLAGYFAAFDNNIMCGHCASWVVNNYGQNKLYIYQAETLVNVEENFELFWKQIQTWIADINSKVEPKLQVQNFEFSTWHDGPKFARYFKQKGLQSTQLRSVIGGAILE